MDVLLAVGHEGRAHAEESRVVRHRRVADKAISQLLERLVVVEDVCKLGIVTARGRADDRVGQRVEERLWEDKRDNKLWAWRRGAATTKVKSTITRVRAERTLQSTVERR